MTKTQQDNKPVNPRDAALTAFRPASVTVGMTPRPASDHVTAEERVRHVGPQLVAPPPYMPYAR